MTETIRCKCGGEVGIVRLNADTLTFGHRVNPRNNRHPVTLARASRSADDRSSTGRTDTFEGIVGRPGSVRTPHTEPRSNATRSEGNGSGLGAAPITSARSASGTASPARRASRVGASSPAPAPRSTRSAGLLR